MFSNIKRRVGEVKEDKCRNQKIKVDKQMRPSQHKLSQNRGNHQQKDNLRNRRIYLHMILLKWIMPTKYTNLTTQLNNKKSNNPFQKGQRT